MSIPEAIVAVAAIAGIVSVVWALIWAVVNSDPSERAQEYTFQWVIVERKPDQQAAEPAFAAKMEGAEG